MDDKNAGQQHRSLVAAVIPDIDEMMTKYTAAQHVSIQHKAQRLKTTVAKDVNSTVLQAGDFVPSTTTSPYQDQPEPGISPNPRLLR